MMETDLEFSKRVAADILKQEQLDELNKREQELMELGPEPSGNIIGFHKALQQIRERRIEIQNGSC